MEQHNSSRISYGEMVSLIWFPFSSPVFHSVLIGTNKHTQRERERERGTEMTGSNSVAAAVKGPSKPPTDLEKADAIWSALFQPSAWHETQRDRNDLLKEGNGTPPRAEMKDLSPAGVGGWKFFI